MRVPAVSSAADTHIRVGAVVVTVKKLRPPVPVYVDHVAVRIER